MKFVGVMKGRPTFHSDETGYTIARFFVEDNMGNRQIENEITVVGNDVPIGQFCNYELDGKITVHPKYGEQFCCESYCERIGKNKDEIVRYLSCGLFKGIGQKTAEKIFLLYGENSIDMIFENPNILLRIKGVSAKKVEEIAESLSEQKVNKELIQFLQHNGLSVSLYKRIVAEYEQKAFDIVKRNPFVLCMNFKVSFDKVNNIAIKTNTCLNSFARLHCGITYILENFVSEKGHTHMEYSVLASSVLSILNSGVSKENYFYEKDIQEALKELNRINLLHMQMIGKILRIYPFNYYNAEVNVAQQIVTRVSKQWGKISLQRIEEATLEAEQVFDLKFNKQQRKAIVEMVNNNFLIVTGSAGTGKTTTLKGMIYVNSKLFPDRSVSLAAPTGRAARRMSEVTNNNEAQTIHSLYNILPDNDDYLKNYLDVLFIDEMLMVGLMVFDIVLSNTAHNTCIVLMGDYNQLLSVDAGNVLLDLLRCDFIPHVNLTEFYRQGEDSTILLNANAVISEDAEKCHIKYDDTFMFTKTKSDEETCEKVCEKYLEFITEYGKDQVQILTPFRVKGLLSALNVNNEIQKLINPSNEGLKVNGIKIKMNDRVINQKNTDVAKNGDIGIVTRIINIDGQKSVLIQWQNGRKMEYTRDDLSENRVTLAYAITVHKSQGSEYEGIIMPMVESQKSMLNCNLFYTGISRAKSKVALVGDMNMVDKAIANRAKSRRNSLLADRIMALYKKSVCASCNETNVSTNTSYEQVMLVDKNVS